MIFNNEDDYCASSPRPSPPPRGRGRPYVAVRGAVDRPSISNVELFDRQLDELSECSPSPCSARGSFALRAAGGGGTKSSVRSAMFIVTHIARTAKLRRSGMSLRSLRLGRRFVEAKVAFMPLLRSLGGLFARVVTINMALLAELGRFPPSKMRARCHGPLPLGEGEAMRPLGERLTL
jgi:hypothetical protein